MLAKAADAISVAEILRLLNGLPSYPSPVARDCSVNGIGLCGAVARSGDDDPGDL